MIYQRKVLTLHCLLNMFRCFFLTDPLQWHYYLRSNIFMYKIISHLSNNGIYYLFTKCGKNIFNVIFIRVILCVLTIFFQIDLLPSVTCIFCSKTSSALSLIPAVKACTLLFEVNFAVILYALDIFVASVALLFFLL